MRFDPNANLVGGFSESDGTIDFYLRIASLLTKDSVVVDLGAGRAEWFEDDRCKSRRDVRLLRGKVKRVIAADVDELVLSNRASDEQRLITNGILDIEDNSVDLIVADWVLEHIDDPKQFAVQIQSCLKSGGWFCARTPHKYSYVSLAARLVGNKSHVGILKLVQPERNAIDVFPTRYKMNTLTDIRQTFDQWKDMSFIFRPEPSYFFGSRVVYLAQSFLHRTLPRAAIGNLFIFVQKP